jgi:hypothetical protein
VLLEIATALEKGIPVIPVLVQDAPMPNSQDLPKAIQRLARREAVKIRDDQWDLDVAHLIRIIKREIPQRFLRALMLAVALALILMLFLIYQFVRGRLPVKLDAERQVSIPLAMLGQDTIIIESPVVNTSSGVLFSHQANPVETIAVELDKAQLSEATAEDFELDPRSSSTFGRIIYTSSQGNQNSASSRPCTTSVEVKLKGGKLPDAIHFSQNRGSGGGNNYRDLEMKCVGADLDITMSTNPQASTSDVESLDDGPGCWKYLKTDFDDGKQQYGAHVVDSIVPADSLFRFRFIPANTNEPLWNGAEGFLKPFVFGSSKQKPEDPLPGLQARAVSIERLVSSNPLKLDNILDIRSVDEKNLLSLDLEVGSKQLRINVSGEGFMRLHDEDVVGLSDRIKRYPLWAGLLAIATAALAVWLTLLLRRFFHSQR